MIQQLKIKVGEENQQKYTLKKAEVGNLVFFLLEQMT